MSPLQEGEERASIVGGPLKIDIHTHVLPESWPDLRERYGCDGWVRMESTGCGCARMLIDDKPFRDVDANLWDPAVRVRDCDGCGVDAQALSTVPVMFSYWAKPEHALDLSRILNDHIAGLVRESPERFVGLGTIPMQAPALACKELERCVRELGMAGVQIGTHIDGWNLDEPQVFEVFQCAEELGAAVFVHPWDMMGKKEMPRHWLPWLVGMPAETSRAICSMLFGGVFERLPRLRVAFAHGGGSFPATIGRIEHGYNVRPDLCATMTRKSPRAQVGSFWVDSLVHDHESLRMLLKLFGAGRVCLGSDYPFPLGESCPGTLVESAPWISSKEREMVLGRSAMEFLGLGEDSPVVRRALARAGSR